MSKMDHIHLNQKGQAFLERLKKQAEENPQFFEAGGNLHVLPQTPVVQGLLAEFCDQSVGCQRFREVVDDLTYLIMSGVSEPGGQYGSKSSMVVNPLGTDIRYRSLDHNSIVLAIQRAGLFMLPGMWRLLKNLKIYSPWLARDHQTLKARWIQKHLPPKLSAKERLVPVFLDDVVTATGDSENEVLTALNKLGYKDEAITVVSIFAAKEGIANIRTSHPGVRVNIAALSKYWLSHIGYIQDGPGDAGDRCCGTV